MAEPILVTGKRISDMELVTVVVGTEKIPTGQAGDLAITPNQIADHTIIRGDLVSQEDLSQVEVSLGTQITDLENDVASADNSIRGLIAAEEAARIAADNLKVDKEGSVSSVAGRVGDVVLAPSDVLVEGFGSQEDVNKYVPKPFLSGYTYGLGERVVLDSGEFVKSLVDGNVGDPNVDMAGWVSTISDSLSDTTQTFNTPEAGVDPVTGVADGAYFNVRSSNDESYLDEYQNVGGAAVATGKSCPSSALVADLKNNTAYFYHTVSAMVADESLTDGKVVGTKGYRNIFDDGGAIYLISSTATNYSIPLANGLHAVFRDTFDVRKFGIQDNATLDQTTELSRMVAYSDNRIYEIDFHGMSIMTPNITHFTTTRGSVIKGLGFNRIHKIKNLHISNNKTTQLQQGTSCLLFLPKENGRGIFKLENVTFDPWVADYKLNYTTPSGEGDGMMMGFLCEAHPEWVVLDRKSTQTEYTIQLENIHFESPAVSYNLACAGFLLRECNLKKATGDYFGLYLFPFAKTYSAEDVTGIHRDDLDAKGRVLVRNLVQDESEIGTTGSLTQDGVLLRNLKATRKTTGAAATVFKHHSVGSITYKKIYAENLQGTFDMYAPADKTTTVDYLVFVKCDSVDFKHGIAVNVGKAEFIDSISNSTFFNNNVTHTISKLHFIRTNVSRLAELSLTKPSILPELKMFECDVSNSTYGIARSGALHINNIELNDITVSSERLIECSFDELIINGGSVTNTALSNFVYLRNMAGTAASANATIRNLRNLGLQKTNTQFVTADAGKTVNLNMSFSNLAERPKITNTVFTEFQISPPLVLSKTFDPPSIPANGGTTTTTLTSSGIANALVVGDSVQASFSTYDDDIEISGSVSSANTVTVKFKNVGTTPIDLASGTLTVKKI